MLEEENGIRMSAKQKRALKTASLGNNPRSLTVVSSATGAKILNNLDKLSNKLNDSATQPKTFIGDLADAIEAGSKGSSSQYATFETINGEIITIRIANHNASTQRMDNAGQNNAISIVITPKSNNGILNDGNAHVVEFYYNSLALRRAEGKPLAEIVQSIKQALYSGEYKDTTGLAKRQEVNIENGIREQRVWHGTIYDFDAFDHSHMSEGEGQQVFGWGTYVTEVEEIGRGYGIAIFNNSDKSNGAEHDEMLFQQSDKEFQRKYGFDPFKYVKIDIYEGQYELQEDVQFDEEMQKFAQEFLKAREVDTEEMDIEDLEDSFAEELFYAYKEIYDEIEEENYRYLYSVEIPDDNGTNYLHWEKPLTKEQQGLIYKLLRDEKIILDMATADFWNGKSRVWNSGSELYNFLNDCFRNPETENDSQQQTSKFLSRAGFTGISYPAEYFSGGRKDGARNYVIFNENDAKIVDKVRFFRTANGEAYGFTVDGKIYIDLTIAGAETAIHEYTHLWATALKNANPQEWSNIVSLMKGTFLWEKVASEYPELTTDDELADEVLAHYSGKRGAEKLRKEAESIAYGKGTLLDKAGAISALERVKEALTRFWKATADLLHIHFTTAEEVADKVLADLLNGVNPNEVAKEYRRKQKQLERINETNPMLDDYHVGIRELSDILTMREAIEEARQEAEEGDYETLSAYPDITNEMLENALQSGKITVYSSKPIKDGNFVTPSRMQAEDYAGDGRVYSKTVSIDDVAWINTDEGQFVKNSKDKAEKAPLRFQFIGKQGAETLDKAEQAIEFHSLIDEMFDNSNFDKSIHLRERYDLGKTPLWMKHIGIIGDNFSLSFKNIKTHKGKDADHNLTREEWHNLPNALKNPFAITRYKGAKDRFRLYVDIKHNDKYIAVGVDVKRINAGRYKPMLSINSIKTLFAHHGEIGGSEELVTYDEKITLEQQALLRGLNFHEYPTIQELSTTKILQNFGNPKLSDENFSEEDDVLYRPREEAPPQNTGIGYKVFVLKKGKLYPPKVANPNGEDTPVGIWLDADAAPIAGHTVTGRSQVKGGGKGTDGGSLKLAYRPGWHLGVIPYALQFNRIDENGDKTLFPANFVWAEV